MIQNNATPARGSGAVSRIDTIDVARGLALVAMAIYHLAWDLEFFGYAEPGLTALPGWKFFARSIASSFLFLVGVSLVLAHGRGVRWKGFGRRLAMVAAAAAAISVVTGIATPDSFIFFGILHQIALASLLGLAFLRLPGTVTLAAAVLVVAAPWFLRSPIFDHPALWWVGLSAATPRSNDYVPLLPWFGAVLAGIGTARLAIAAGIAGRLATAHPRPWSRPLKFAGRHSLAVYLIHQPALIALIWTLTQFIPPQMQSVEAAFVGACNLQCAETRDAAFCIRYCACMLDKIEQEGLMERIIEGSAQTGLQERLRSIADICAVDSNDAPFEENDQ